EPDCKASNSFPNSTNSPATNLSNVTSPFEPSSTCSSSGVKNPRSQKCSSVTPDDAFNVFVSADELLLLPLLFPSESEPPELELDEPQAASTRAATTRSKIG